MKQEKSVGIAYLLEIMLFFVGGGWFYIDRILRGFTQSIISVFLFLFLMALKTLNTYFWWENDGLISFLTFGFALSLLIWIIMDMVKLKAAVIQCNEVIKAENRASIKEIFYSEQPLYSSVAY